MEKNRNLQSEKAYAAAGVDVDLGNRVKSGIPALVKRASS